LAAIDLAGKSDAHGARHLAAVQASWRCFDGAEEPGSARVRMLPPGSILRPRAVALDAGPWIWCDRLSVTEP
jgi:hypothetical protein